MKTKTIDEVCNQPAGSFQKFVQEKKKFLQSMNAPIKTKTQTIVQAGYEHEDFSYDYWLAPDGSGTRRIDRPATQIIDLTRNLVRYNIVPSPAPRILDIGAGPGNIVHGLREAGFECEGCEFSESGRSLAREHFNIDLEFCDLRHGLPLPGHKWFYFAFCVGVLTMIPRSFIPMALKGINGVLAPGGILHVNLLNPSPDDNSHHLTALNYQQWHAEFEKAGLKDVTSLWPPQRHGIGMISEFCGLFRKDKAPPRESD